MRRTPAKPTFPCVMRSLLSALALVVGLAACNPQDQADTESVAVDDADGGDPVRDEQASDPSDDGRTQIDFTDRPVPADQVLDRELRHPGGALMHLKEVRFAGTTIEVDLEIINGHSKPVRFALTGGQRLRLVDDRGNIYNVVVPDDMEAPLKLEPGESVSGTFAFLGPVVPGVSEFVLAVNTLRELSELRDYDVAEQLPSTATPTFVFDGIPVEVD